MKTEIIMQMILKNILLKSNNDNKIIRDINPLFYAKQEFGKND